MGWGAWGGRRGGGEEETRVRTEVEIAGQGPAARPSSADRFCRATATEREGGQRGHCMMQCDGVGAPARHLRSAAEFGSLSHQPHAVRAALGALGHLSELQLDHAANRPDDQGAYLAIRHVRG